MKSKSFFNINTLIAILLFAISGAQNSLENETFTETVKVALRDVGNKLLLANKDSTSLILPIKKISADRYEITFQKQLSISPDSLVAITNQSLKKANLPKRYIVEVLNCFNREVFYSFKMTNSQDKDIIPCSNRLLPTDCYSIKVRFFNDSIILKNNNNYLIIGGLILITACIIIFFYKTNKKKNIENTVVYRKIGNYKFYEAQNKLVKDAVEISLSAKECELINMLSQNQNQVIKRDVLIKEIWEDHGVFVGRSLDTFISKLRKKFKDDDSINIVNVHGIGYKLEVN